MWKLIARGHLQGLDCPGDGGRQALSAAAEAANALGEPTRLVIAVMYALTVRGAALLAEAPA